MGSGIVAPRPACDRLPVSGPRSCGPVPASSAGDFVLDPRGSVLYAVLAAVRELVAEPPAPRAANPGLARHRGYSSTGEMDRLPEPCGKLGTNPCRGNACR